MNYCFRLLPASAALLLLTLTGCQGNESRPSETEVPQNVSIEVSEQGGKVTVKESNGATVRVNGNGAAVQTGNAPQQQDAPVPSGYNDWDDVLDRYERYAQQWLRLRDASMGGNQAEQEAGDLHGKAEELQQALDRARSSNDLTPAQERRYNRITARFMKEMMTPPADLMDEQE